MSETTGKLAGAAGIHGTDYQIKLYMLFLIRGYINDYNFRLSAENKMGGKFDDLVFERDQEIILLQAKHIDNDDKKLSATSVFAKTGRFSLMKYLDSCKELKLDPLLRKTYVLCTNIDINKELSDRFLSRTVVEQTDALYNLNSHRDQYFYTFKQSETLDMLKNANSDIQQDKVLPYLENLRLIILKDREIEQNIRDMLHQYLLDMGNELNINSTYDFIFNKLKSWFSDKKLTYLTKIHLDAYFSEMISTNFVENLRQHYDKISFSNIPADEQVVMIKTSRYLILMVKLYLQLSNENNKRILFVNPRWRTFQTKMINAFQLPHFTHLICSISEEQRTGILEDLLSKISSQNYKRIIILTKDHFPLKCSQKIVHLSDCDFYKDLKISRNFKMKFNNSQGEFYLKRTYIETTNSDNALTENDFSNLVLQNDHHILIISDIPGMGKTTVLSNITNTINQFCENLLAVKLELNNFAPLFESFLKKKKFLELDDLLESDSIFDSQMLLLPGVLILLCDGLDEICSNHINFFLKFIKNNYKNKRIYKLIISVRPHAENAIKEAGLYEMARVFHLKPLTRHEQHSFIFEYWMTTLNIPENQREKCKTYGELLMATLSSTINDSETLIGIPLLIKMLSEIFKEQVRQHCANQENKEEINDIIFKTTWNISRLFDMFITRQRDIFIEEKASAKGNKFVIDALTDKFQNVLELCGNLAFKMIFPGDISKKFVEKTSQDNKIFNLCDTGLVAQFRGGIRFLHRTFAEFLIAKRLFRKIMNGNVEDIRCIILNVLNNWNYEAIHHFLDGILDIEWKNLPSDIFYIFSNIIKVMHLENKKPALYQLTKHKCTSVLKLFLNECDISREILNTLDPAFLIQEAEPLYYHPGCNIRNCFYYLPEKLNPSALGNKASLLHCAAYTGSLDIVRYFIGKGAAINTQTSHGISVLHVAVDKGHFSIIKFLIDKGTNIHARSGKYSTPLHFSALSGYLDISKYLIEMGSHVHARTGIGETVIHKAVLGKNLELVQYFIHKGVDLHAQTGSRITALHYAVLVNDLAITKYLVEQGADVNAKLIKDVSVLHKAVQAGNLSIIKYLIENGANVNVVSKLDSTPLSDAIEGGNLDIIKSLIDNGADIFFTDQKGYTILQKVARKGPAENEEYLTQKGLKLWPFSY